MSLNSMMLKAVMAHLDRPEMRIASFGYPDIPIGEDELRRIVPARIRDFGLLKYRPDSDEICRRHGKEKQRIPDSASLFSLFGAQLDVFDVVKERGTEIICDLNKPAKLPVVYDIVIDPGTLEHCFNIGQAAFNVAGCAKVGGHVLHSNPFMAGNHGFYGLNPTWYADFYGQNGFEVMLLSMQAKAMTFVEMTDTERFCPTVEHHMFVIAKRKQIVELRYPTQSKYKALIDKEQAA